MSRLGRRRAVGVAVGRDAFAAPIDRRTFLRRAGTLAAALGLTQVPAVVGARGWSAAAAAQDPNIVLDTFKGLVAFVVPGPDAYSVAQGQDHPEPGGVDADAASFLVEALDYFVPAPDEFGENDDTVQLSPAIAALLNMYALQVNPVAAAGPFPSHFARLTFDEKVEVFRRLETTDLPDEDLPEPFNGTGTGNTKFVAGALLEFSAFGTYCEWQMFDAEARTLTDRPVGWQLTGYQPVGPVEGHDELLGYYQGRREATG